VLPAPVEQVLDERDQALVGPVEILEDHHERPLLRHALEEPPPGGEEVLAVRGGAFAQTEELQQPWFDPCTLGRVRDVKLESGRELGSRLDCIVLLHDLGATSYHLRERPERDPVSVREATAAVPPDIGRETVDVLLELPREP